MTEWIYKTNEDNTSRYILGTKGVNPLICFGVNPSTAEPGDLDPTMENVRHFALNHGYDSFIMLNLYPQRATEPNNMDKRVCCEEFQYNLGAVESVLKSGAKTIWVAWGALVEKRRYLLEAVEEIYKLGHKYDVNWVAIGKVLKAGHPHHPLYVKRNQSFNEFDMEAYLEKVERILEKRKYRI